jgi:nucleotide exchange factor SIL1
MKTIYLLALLPVGALATFEATNNWQPVEQDEQLPPGLHVRLNVNTGQREAKLMDPNDKSGDIVVIEPSPTVTAGEGRDRAILDKGLWSIKSQLAVGHELMENLADLAHDIEFGSMIVGAVLPELVSIIVNLDHSSEFRDTAARALGASLRNNPSSLDTVFNSNVHIVSKLIHGLEVEKDEKLQGRLLYVLGSCMGDRRGRTDFATNNGGDAIRVLFSRAEPKIKIKCLELVNDYMVDNQDAEIEWRRDEVNKWADSLQRDLVIGEKEESQLEILETLANLKRLSLVDMTIGDDFVEWLARMDTLRKDDRWKEPLSKQQQQVLEEVGRVRHAVFGNSKASRKQHADEL